MRNFLWLGGFKLKTSYSVRAASQTMTMKVLFQKQTTLLLSTTRIITINATGSVCALLFKFLFIYFQGRTNVGKKLATVSLPPSSQYLDLHDN